MEHSRITLMGLGNYVSELEEDQDDCSELEEDEEDQDVCSDDCFETDISGNWFGSLYHLTVEKSLPHAAYYHMLPTEVCT